MCIASSSSAEISMHITVLQESATTDSSTDITASGDGTWKIRGHSSLIGACVVVGGNYRESNRDACNSDILQRMRIL